MYGKLFLEEVLKITFQAEVKCVFLQIIICITTAFGCGANRIKSLLLKYIKRLSKHKNIVSHDMSGIMLVCNLSL